MYLSGGFRRNWPYLALLVFIVLPLGLIALMLAVRSGLFNGRGTPNSESIKVFVAFIGGGLATAATVFGWLLTREHNERERWRLRMEAVLKSLESLPAGEQPRLAGALSTIVLLGQPRIATRVLGPAWEKGSVDPGTATWLVGQVLAGSGASSYLMDGDRPDEAAINEAAALLKRHSGELAEEGVRGPNFPGYFFRRWTTRKELPFPAKEDILLTIGGMLLTRDKGWWCPGGKVPVWPTEVLVECARDDSDPIVRKSAAVLLEALDDSCPDTFIDRRTRENLKAILDKVASGVDVKIPAPTKYTDYANKIRERWGVAKSPSRFEGVGSEGGRTAAEPAQPDANAQDADKRTSSVTGAGE